MFQRGCSMAVGMGGVMLFQVFVPLLLVATASSSEKSVFGLTGGSIVLQAEPVTEKVTSIIWKHEKDKAAEWFEGDDVPLIFDKFTPVATLNTQTWALHISKLQTGFNGKYSAEVNNKDPTQFLTLTVLGPVSKPEITTDCNDPKINCTLTCEGKEVKFTKYTWANDIDEWTGSELPVERRDHDVVYTCNFSNPVSWATSHGTVKKYVPPLPDPSGPTGGIIGVILIVGFILYACICLLLFIKQGKSLTDLRTMTCRDRCRIFIPCIKERKTSGDEEKQKPVTPPVPPGQDQSSEAEPMLTGVSENNEAHGDEEMTNNGGVKPPEVKTDSSHEGNPTENGPGSTAEEEPNEHDRGEEEQQLPNNEDKRQPETDPDPAPERKLPANGPGSTADEEPEEPNGGKENQQLPNTERKEPDGIEDSPGMPNPEDKRQPETDTDPLHEGKLTANAPGSTAEEEDKEQPEANTDPLHGEKLAEPFVAPTADGEPNEHDGGEEEQQLPNNEVIKQTEANTGPLHEGELTGNGAGPTADGVNNEAHGGKESPEKTNTEVIKQTEANTGPLHEGELTEPVVAPTADGENNEAHGGKESPEKTNTDKKQTEANTDPLHEGKLTENDPGSTADGVDKERGGVEEKKQLLNTEDKKQTEANTDPLHEGELTENGQGSTADGERKEGDGKEDNPEMSNTEDKKQTGANTDPLDEGKSTKLCVVSAADEENNEAHGGKESPEKTNTEH